MFFCKNEDRRDLALLFINDIQIFLQLRSLLNSAGLSFKGLSFFYLKRI